MCEINLRLWWNVFFCSQVSTQTVFSLIMENGLDVRIQLLHVTDSETAAGYKNSGGNVCGKNTRKKSHARFPKFPCQVISTNLVHFPSPGFGPLFVVI